MPNFAKEYTKLNTDQKAAVDYIEGPLLVIAGPGTGKTQLLSLRTANILKKTDTLPENILCLTFTESGAQEMRRRLIDVIGDEAYKITVSTYHGFGSEIITQNPSYFMSSSGLRPINSLKADSIIRDIQKSLPYTSEFKDSQSIKAISSLISDTKQAGLNPEALADIADSNLGFIKSVSETTRILTKELTRASKKSVPSFEKLIVNTKAKPPAKGIEPLATIWNEGLIEAIDDLDQTGKATSLSKWKAKFLEKDKDNQYVAKGKSQNERLLELSKIYGQYNDRLQKYSLFDYDDMILRSIEALKSNEELRYNLQEKYLYIMLDEYQDTNLAQAELVDLLTNKEITDGKPNIMAVGDDDQAIYAFQGAKHSNMLDFTNNFNDVKLITLKTNYRSTQNIVDISSRTSDQIKSKLTKELKTVQKDFTSYAKQSGRINAYNFNNEIDQYNWLTSELKNTNKKVAIIAPEHKYLERASAYLIAENIPISYERRENVLEDPIIEQILTILMLLDAINKKDSRLSDSLLAIVLNYEFLELPTKNIWELSWRASDTNTPWLTLMLKDSKLHRLALMLIKLAANSLAYRYDFIIDQVIGLSDIVLNDPKPVSTRSPLMKYYSKEGDNMSSRLFQNLITLRQQFSEFNNDNNKPLMISDLIDFVDQLNVSNEKITNDLSYIQSKANVELLSAHSAKGLEFDAVYLLSFVNEVWGPKKNNNRLSLPSNLEHIRQRADDPDDEKLRLLYVALSRAKTSLTTLSYDLNDSAKQMAPLRYLNIPAKTPKLKTASQLIPLWQKEDRPLEITTDLKALLKKRIETYPLSPTEFNTFIDIRGAGPKAFYNQVLLKYKTPMSPRMDYGSSIHNTLDWLQKSLKTTNKLPTLKQLLDEFNKALLKRRLLKEDYEHLKQQGIAALTVYYNASKATLSKDDFSEYDFRSEGELINGKRITGKVDKLAVNTKSKQITIIDYKTGKPARSWSSQAKIHLYKNQLYFYKLLVEKSSAFKSYEVTGARLDFVQHNSDNKNTLELEYDKVQEDRLINLIAAVWKHIDNLDFPSVNKYKPNTAGIIKFEDDLISGKI